VSGKSIASFVGDELSFLKLGSVLVGFHLGGGGGGGGVFKVVLP